MVLTRLGKVKSASFADVRRFQRYFNRNQFKFIVLGITFFVLSFLGTLPYLNLIFNKTAVLFIVWILAVFLLNLSGKVSVAGALVCLGFCPLFLIFKKEPVAEELANLAFGLLVIGVGQEFIRESGKWKRGKTESRKWTT